MEVGVWGYVNHTAKQIVPFRAKNYQQLFWSGQPYIGSDMPVAQKNEITGFQWQ